MTEAYIEGKAGAMAATQKKTFTRWMNYFLSERMLKVNDLFTDLKDGRILINLLELISSKKLPKYNLDPKMTVHELENLNTALEFLTGEGLKFVGIGSIDIHNGVPKLILGLIWTIILRYQIQQGGDGASPKSELLEWVNKQIAPYEKLGIGPAEDFTKSWQDGKILAALTDSLKPGVMDCRNLKDPLRDTAKAMGEAEKNYQIPQLVDASDMVHNPDEHSNMTYISYFRDWVMNEKKRAGEVATKGPRNNMCFAKGKGVEGGFARRPLPFTIHSRTVNDTPVTAKYAQDFKVRVTGPSGDVPVSDLKDNGDGTWFCRYTAPVGGKYNVAIDLVGDPSKGQSHGPIKGSVYTLQVKEPGDPTKSWAEGPGLIKSTEGKPAYFTVHVKDKDGKPVAGDMPKVDVKLVEKAPDAAGGTGEVPVDVKDNGDGTYSVRYDPAVAGKYRVNVTLDDKPIKEMPKIVQCYHPVSPGHSIARGPGVTPGVPTVGAEAPFAVIAKDAKGNNVPVGGHDLKVTVTGPSGPIPCDIKDDNSGVYQCKYTPREPGPHVVDVRLEGGPVKDNPFRLNIATPADPSKSWAEGPGLHHAFDNRPAKFKVHAVDKNGKPVAGETLDIKVLPKGGGESVPVNITDNGDGTYDVSYKCDTPGKYVIHTNIRGTPIKDMPKEITCHPGVDASKSIIEGPGVTGGMVNTDLPFTIRSMDKDGKPVRVGGDEYKVVVESPDGKSFPVEVKDNGDGTYSGHYKPNKVGNWKVMAHVNHQKAPVGKSPYTAKVRAGASGKTSFAVGRGWKEAYDMIPAKFTIHAKDLDGQPVAGETVRVIMKNVTPADKKAALQKEVDGIDDYLKKKKIAKLQKLEAERKKDAAKEAKHDPSLCHTEEGSDIPVEVRDNGDGTYLATYTAIMPGIYRTSVTVGDNREHIKDSPKDIPVHLSRPKIVYWRHTYEAQKKRLEAAEALLQKHGLTLPPE